MNFGGFWRRAIATMIDALLIVLASTLLLVPLLTVLGLREELPPNQTRSAFFSFLLAAYSMTTLAIVIMTWLYYAIMESGRRKATVGKLLMNLRVATMNGDPLTFATASARFFGKIISAALLGAGFIMQPFTPRKQALHDIIAGTVVLRRPVPTPVAEPVETA